MSSRPSGKGNKGDEGINYLEKRFLGWLEQIFEEIPQEYYVRFTKKLEEPYTRAGVELTNPQEGCKLLGDQTQDYLQENSHAKAARQ